MEDSITAEEAEYLKNYHLSDYKQPSVTTDIAVFNIMEREEGRTGTNYRKDPVKELRILLVKRGHFPYKDAWALPGGFMQERESTQETALRELKEETGVDDAYLRPFGIYSTPGRDPRGWIISHAFYALICNAGYKVRADTDAWDAKWFTVTVEKGERERKKTQTAMTQSRIYTLKLSNGETGVNMQAQIMETKNFNGLHCNTDYEITDAGGLAFDHALIILNAWQEIQKETENSGMIIFDLMPEKFTLNELRTVFELVLGHKLLVANFRRKFAPYVVETEEETAGAGHRPAKLFVRNPEKFCV